jgi:nucleotide-binding universal stress UspA family protein
VLQDVPSTKLVTPGPGAAALRRYARSGRWDIVVGQAERRPRLPLRDEPGERLARRSPAPVLVVRDEPIRK